LGHSLRSVVSCIFSADMINKVYTFILPHVTICGKAVSTAAGRGCP
jgi:hypothetical protein